MSDTALYVYGIVPADVEAEADARGVGDPPGQVEIVRDDDIAALVSPVPADHPLGTPDDLQAHARLLDGTAIVAPVLPLRFGAVMTDADAVVGELLREYHDEFAHALKALEGHAQYVIKGRYDDGAFLEELVANNKQAQALRDDIHNKPEDASRDSRIALGELIANTIETNRQQDTATVTEALEGIADAVNAREPSNEWDAVNVALLARVERQGDVEALVDRLSDNAGDRVELRLLGPMAPYDFVVTKQPEG